MRLGPALTWEEGGRGGQSLNPGETGKPLMGYLGLTAKAGGSSWIVVKVGVPGHKLSKGWCPWPQTIT